MNKPIIKYIRKINYIILSFVLLAYFYTIYISSPTQEILIGIASFLTSTELVIGAFYNFTDEISVGKHGKVFRGRDAKLIAGIKITFAVFLIIFGVLQVINFIKL